MCGGNIQVTPCSRVGHVFRYRRPYKNPARRDSDSRNNMRTILVWIDEPHYRVRYRYSIKESKEANFGIAEFYSNQLAASKRKRYRCGRYKRTCSIETAITMPDVRLVRAHGE